MECLEGAWTAISAIITPVALIFVANYLGHIAAALEVIARHTGK